MKIIFSIFNCILKHVLYFGTLIFQRRETDVSMTKRDQIATAD